jgi:cupin 2 domain-containing protein
MTVTVKNIFADVPQSHPGEEIAALFENSAVKIDRIISHSHSSPEGFWYDQRDDEWVMVLRGTASLEFADGEVVEMSAGDYVIISRHVRHRVRQTSGETIWLAVHVK